MLINEANRKFNYIFLMIILSCFLLSRSVKSIKSTVNLKSRRNELSSKDIKISEAEREIQKGNMSNNSELFKIKIFDDSVFAYKKGNCNSQMNCLLPYGICLNDSTCMCMPEYADIHSDSNHLSCAYRRKKAVVAGILELFLPFGLGHAYAGHLYLSFIKFVYIMIVYILGYYLSCKSYASNEEDTLMLNTVFFCIILACTIPIWNILDMFLYVNGVYRDGKGVPLS